MDTWVCSVACWVDGGECEVAAEVKATGSLSGASDSDEALGFAESRSSSMIETCVRMPAMSGL